MRFALFFVLSLTVALENISAQHKVSQGKTPAWVTPYGYTNISDTLETVDGYAYLLVSRQNNLESKEEYYKYVTKVTSEAGMSSVASINEWFDPSFQKLTFHELNIIRDGKKINKLDPSRFDVLRREEEMERAVYDKSVNAVYNLSDVRVGDVVEYAFTRKGINPVFGDHSFGRFYLQYGAPVGKFAHRVVCSPKRKILFKAFNDSTLTAREGQLGQLRTFEWVRVNVPALLFDDQYPDWLNPYINLQYSDFGSWSEMKSWARNLYTFPKLTSSHLKTVVETIRKSGKSDEEKIKACIRISQGDIRYLSFSDGIHGYKPHSPEMVYDQKYGDCKDKSFMLALMLNDLGFKSSPVLVSTQIGYSLPDVLPNPWAFNHCVVQFTYNDSTYWIDPTLDVQIGPLNSYQFPTYHHALVIHDEHSELTPIPFGYHNSRTEVEEEYSMSEIGGDVRLKIRTTYYGKDADGIRSYFRANTIDQINKDYLNFYAREYSQITLVKDFTHNIDLESNIVVANEEYLLKNFWKDDKGTKTASTYAGVLAAYLKKPSTRIRTMPLAIEHPTNISQTITIRLPEEWDVTDTETDIESEGFTYHQSTVYRDKVITLRYRYNSKASFIRAEAAGDHIAKLGEAHDDTGYSLYKPGERTVSTPSGATDHNVSMYITIAVVIAIGAFVYKQVGDR